MLVYEPPHRLALAWHLDGSWQFDPDPQHASEVEIRFLGAGEGRTRVELEHRGFERHGEGAAAVRGGIESPRGSDYCLDRYRAHVAA